MSNKSTPKRISLNEFLAGVPAETSEQLSEVVATMMRNEQVATKLRGVEAELRPFFITAALCFIIGMVVLVFYSEPGGFLDSISGAWPILTTSLGFLPGLLTYYAVRIRKRSQADVHNFDLNKEHFLPHGAIYFPSDAAVADQVVTLVDVNAPSGVRPSKYDKLKPGTIW
jgi:hypothetical protein